MLDDTCILSAWEQGYQALPLERALLLASLAEPETGASSLAERSIGQRDAAIFQLRRRLFGDGIEALAKCPQCGESLELAFELGDVLAQAGAPHEDRCRWQSDDLEVEFRLPTSADLLAAGRLPPGERPRRLLRLCILEASRRGEPIAVESLPADALDGVSHAIAAADPLAEIEFELKCIQCEHVFRTPFDIVAFLWSELNAWCQRRLLEVHALAKAYGWSEREILSLGPWRRQVYLNMVRQ